MDFDLKRQQIIAQIDNFGLCPKQIFFKNHPKRFNKLNLKQQPNIYTFTHLLTLGFTGQITAQDPIEQYNDIKQFINQKFNNPKSYLIHYYIIKTSLCVLIFNLKKKKNFMLYKLKNQENLLALNTTPHQKKLKKISLNSLNINNLKQYQFINQKLNLYIHRYILKY